jgi:hypothetical protein
LLLYDKVAIERSYSRHTSCAAGSPPAAMHNSAELGVGCLLISSSNRKPAQTVWERCLCSCALLCWQVPANLALPTQLLSLVVLQCRKFTQLLYLFMHIQYMNIKIYEHTIYVDVLQQYLPVLPQLLVIHNLLIESYVWLCRLMATPI